MSKKKAYEAFKIPNSDKYAILVNGGVFLRVEDIHPGHGVTIVRPVKFTESAVEANCRFLNEKFGFFPKAIVSWMHLTDYQYFSIEEERMIVKNEKKNFFRTAFNFIFGNKS